MPIQCMRIISRGFRWSKNRGNIAESVPRSYMRDEGRSLRAALQGEALNRPKLLEVERPQVVSVEEKAYKDTSGMDQEGER